jgi:hypothetical protein
MRRDQPPRRLLRAIRSLTRGRNLSPTVQRSISEACRAILREYRAVASEGRLPNGNWRDAAAKALHYLGGDADLPGFSLLDYNHSRFGPFLGVSDDGTAADDICRAALASPKAQALGDRASPLAVGVALDAERLSGVGELPVGPDEYSNVWCACAGRNLMTTNIGTRINARHYLPPPIITVSDGPVDSALASAEAELVDTFSRFLKTPDNKPRPLLAFVEFELGSTRPFAERKLLLQKLVKYIKSGGIAAPKVHRLGFNIRIGWGLKGRNSALRAIDLARAAGIRDVSIDGVVRKEADRAISLPGLTNYLDPELVSQILRYARRKTVRVRPLELRDPDTIARSIWSALNTARCMGLHLGKYSLYPLTLEESAIVVGQVQRWFSGWAAAPVFYVDQGIINSTGVYVGRNRANGVKIWLRAMARQGAKIVLIDTVDKSKGWMLVRSGDDPKGLLRLHEVAEIAALGQTLGIKVLWAGGITGPHAYELGRLGVFGIYVTTAAAIDVAVAGTYSRDPGMAKMKRPSFSGVLNVKTLLEAGYLSQRVKGGAKRSEKRLHGAQDNEVGQLDVSQISRALPAAWREWWRVSK